MMRVMEYTEGDGDSGRFDSLGMIADVLNVLLLTSTITGTRLFASAPFFG